LAGGAFDFGVEHLIFQRIERQFDRLTKLN